MTGVIEELNLPSGTRAAPISSKGQEPASGRSPASKVDEQIDRVERLIGYLGNPVSNVRESVAEELGQIGSPHAVEALIALMKDGDPGVRRSAVWALGEIKDPRAVEPLIAARRDPDANVRHEADASLEKIRAPHDMALTQVSQPREAPPPSAIRNDTPRQVVAPASRVTELIRQLKESNSAIRTHAAWELGQLKDPIAVEPLIDALKDPDDAVRRQAASALKAINDPRSVEPLRTEMEAELKTDSAATARTITLRGGTICHPSGRDTDSISCIRNNALLKSIADITPRLHLIDEQGPKDYFGKKRGLEDFEFNGDFGGFKVPISAGRHTIAVSFYQKVGARGAESDWANVSFVAIAGHTYEVDAIEVGAIAPLHQPKGWVPIVSDVTDQANWKIVSQLK